MKNFFTFRFKEKDKNKRESVAVFFTTTISSDVISKIIREDFENNLYIEKVYIITPENLDIEYDQYNANSAFATEFKTYVGDIENNLKFLKFDHSGTFFYDYYNKPKESVPKNTSKALLQDGMIYLFKKYKGVISSSHGYHFEKPSGDHCDKFIRASNLLVSSIEVSFLAISLLPYFEKNKNIKRIYVDTSSIAYLINIAIQLFDDFEDHAPSIESFESYTSLTGQTDFVEDEDSFLFISATTSGSLTEKLLSKTNFKQNQIVTLFHIYLPPEQDGIFDVTTAIDNGIISKRDSECLLCERGAKLIRITGDQFLPQTPNDEFLMIKKDHFNSERKDFFKQFAAKSVLKWNCSASNSDREHFFIDVKNALSLKSESFSKSLLKNIKRYLSQDLAIVITFPDEDSEALKEKLCNNIKGGTTNIKWFAPKKFTEDDVRDAASVIVIVSAITSGKGLFEISRKLRGINSSATVTYFVAFSKLPNKESLLHLKKDLEEGGHNFVVLSSCPVPRFTSNSKTAWDSERDNLYKYCDEDNFKEEETLPKALSKRLSLIDGQAKNKSGNSNKLFLLDPMNKIMKLRQRFVFWSGILTSTDIKKSTQSDVYWTIQCVLHDLRNASENGGLTTIYHKTLISPANFNRYNDGVIQACLLRSALPIEMDYCVDEKYSRQMTNIIYSVIENWKNIQGEASMEFLMALWCKRLRLESNHLKEIISLRDDAMPDCMTFLLDRIKENLNE